MKLYFLVDNPQEKTTIILQYTFWAFTKGSSKPKTKEEVAQTYIGL